MNERIRDGLCLGVGLAVGFLGAWAYQVWVLS